jgi:hypothetical protein
MPVKMFSNEPAPENLDHPECWTLYASANIGKKPGYRYNEKKTDRGQYFTENVSPKFSSKYGFSVFDDMGPGKKNKPGMFDMAYFDNKNSSHFHVSVDMGGGIVSTANRLELLRRLTNNILYFVHTGKYELVDFTQRVEEFPQKFEDFPKQHNFDGENFRLYPIAIKVITGETGEETKMPHAGFIAYYKNAEMGNSRIECAVNFCVPTDEDGNFDFKDSEQVLIKASDEITSLRNKAQFLAGERAYNKPIKPAKIA